MNVDKKMGSLGVALIGYGRWGQKVSHALQRSGIFHIVSVVDTSPDRLAIAGRERFVPSTLQEAVEDKDVDLIIVTAPSHSHFSLVKLAIQAGKHVHCAKPLATTVAEAEELLALAKTADVLLTVDQVSAFVPGIKRLIALAHAGRFGDLYFARSTRLNFGTFRQDVDVVWDLAPHDLTIMDRLANGTMPTITGCCVSTFPSRSKCGTAYANLSYGGGQFEANIFVSWVAPRKSRDFIVFGSEAIAVFNELTASLTIHNEVVFPGPLLDGDFLVSTSLGSGHNMTLEPEEPLLAEFASVALAIESHDHSLGAAESAVRTVRILEAVDRARSGQR